jgi:hypothetical protein
LHFKNNQTIIRGKLYFDVLKSQIGIILECVVKMLLHLENAPNPVCSNEAAWTLREAV